MAGGIGRCRRIDRGELDVVLRLVLCAAGVLRHHLVDGEELCRGRRGRARNQRRDGPAQGRRCDGRGNGGRLRRRLCCERGDDDRLRRALELRNGGGIACGDVRDDGDLAGRGRIGVERRHGDEAEEQHNRQPLDGDTRPRLRTHVQHPASGALKRQLNVPLAPDLLTELAIRPALLRLG